MTIVKERGKLMQEATSEGFGGMAAISGLNPLFVEEECAELSNAGERITVANYNSATQVVISGEKSLVQKACENLSKLGATTIPLNVSAPFHTSYMEPANQKFKRFLAEKKINVLKWPVISNVDAKPYTDLSHILDKLSVQMVSPVRWKETIDYLLRQGINTFIELGPKSVLTKLVKRDFSHVRAYSYEENYDEIIAVIKEQAEEKRPSLVSRCLAIAVCTRNQNWDEEEYQKGVIEPYRRIQALSNKIEEEGREETMEEMQQALDMLLSVFRTKRTPVEEQKERFTQIFDETRKRHLFPDFELKY